MTMMRFNSLSTLLLTAAFGASLSPALAAQAGKTGGQPAYCWSRNLEVQQIALDSPGMMHANSFYVVLNRGSDACILRAGPVLLWSNDKAPKPGAVKPDAKFGQQPAAGAGQKGAAQYTLPPVPANGKMALKDLVGFPVSNSGAGDGDWFSSLSVQLPDAKGRPMRQTYRAKYQGYANFPIPRTRLVLQPFLSWNVLDGDGCMPEGSNNIVVGQGESGNIRNPTAMIDVRSMLKCG
jgi:hypothetical protein